MALESIPAHSGFRGGHIGQAYNEAAFRYFLAVDRWRAQRSQRSIILVLASVRQSPGRNLHLTHAAAAAMFAGLAASVREVDFVGWYRKGRVAGAVLAQAAGAPDQLRQLIGRRVLAALEQHLPAAYARRLHLRIVRLGRATTLMLFTTTSRGASRQARDRRSEGRERGRPVEWHHLISEDLFRDALVRERKRADRFEEAFVVLLVTLDGRSLDATALDATR